jgi:uncharacterized repeat protein (TIGR01451 family)
MSRQEKTRRSVSRASRPVLGFALTVAAVLFASQALLRAQPPAPVPALSPAPPAPNVVPGTGTPGAAVVDNGAAAAIPVIPPDVQVVRFQGPAGVTVEVLGPAPEPVSSGDGHGLGTVGLKVGVGYRLRLANLPERPGAELFPVIEVVGHLHRPEGIDPSRFPIRVTFSFDDLVDAVDRARLVTLIVYLEDPDQALPLALPKDEIPVVTLSPTEEPLRVAKALGRPMAIVRIGGRHPSVDEFNGPGPGPAAVGMEGVWSPTRCPFIGPENRACGLPCGPVRGTPPSPGRPWLPRDEYLCDGGDRAEPAHFGGDGNLRGIDPRDAVMQFSDGRRPRVLPTNVVCIYAPRFAEVRASLGTNENLIVESAVRAERSQRQITDIGRQYARRLVKNEALEIDRGRLRASGLIGRVSAGVHSEIRVLAGYDSTAHIINHILIQGPEQYRNRFKPETDTKIDRAIGITTPFSAVVTGIVQGASAQVMSWPARETVGVEVPPNKPGMAVIKRVSSGVAEPGEVLTFVIQFRNMGNYPIRAVSIIDSLLPRLEYVAGSAQGPKGTVFTAAENRVGSTELRWDLPGAIAPGAEGYVSFQTRVR